MLGRRTPATPETPQDDTAVPDPRSSGSTAGSTTGKGRPTPKRRDAERRRVPVTAPTNRRDAARQRRQQASVRRNDARRALVAGDERALPARDRGPVRRYVRDWVDGQWTASEFFLPFLLVLWVPTFAGGSIAAVFSYVLVLVVLFLLAELMLKTFLLRRALTKQFPAGGQGRKGALGYGAMRLASMRFVRLPKPAVRRGEAPRPVS